MLGVVGCCFSSFVGNCCCLLFCVVVLCCYSVGLLFVLISHCLLGVVVVFVVRGVLLLFDVVCSCVSLFVVGCWWLFLVVGGG